MTVAFARFGFTTATVKYQDYGCGGLAYPESFQEVAPKTCVAEKGKPIALEIGRHSYALLRFCE